MKKLLYIESSPRKERSYSIKISNEFIKEYKKTHPGDKIEIIDLWSYQLPEFDKDTIQAKYRILHGQEHTPSEAKAWNKVIAVFKDFANADKYLFSVPMWNFGIPYKLKHFIDVITQPGLSFTVTSDGYKGLVSGKPALVIYVRGGEYSTNQQAKKMDFQKSYLETLLGFIGFTDIKSILCEQTLSDAETIAQAEKQAKESAIAIAKNF